MSKNKKDGQRPDDSLTIPELPGVRTIMVRRVKFILEMDYKSIEIDSGLLSRMRELYDRTNLHSLPEDKG